MASTQIRGQVGGLSGKKENKNDWAYQGISLSNIEFEGNFQADADLSLTSPNDPNDSGYFSSGDNPESSTTTTTHKITTGDHFPSSYASSQAGASPSDYGYAESFCSTKPNHGSIYDGVNNERTQIIPRYAVYDCQATAHSTEGDESQYNHANFSSEITGPSPLEEWQQSYERHESIATQFQQPAKRRNTKSARQ